jgi:putative endonuclease
MAYVYILVAIPNFNISYIGWTYDLKERVKKHNNGQGAKFTRGRKWKLVYYELLKNKSAALKRENALKKNRILRNQIKKKYKNIDILNDK